MSERKWTPGPWEVSGDNGRILSHWDGIGYWEIANAAPTGFEGDSGKTYSAGGDREANARLISAAPDLFEALEALFNAIDSSVDLTPEVMMSARAALSKAKGDDQ